MTSFSLTASVLLMLGACAVPHAPIGPEGRLDVLAPDPGFFTRSGPNDWVVDGAFGGPGDGAWSLTRQGGVPALKMINGRTPLIVVRRTTALVLATPFLSWAWNVGPYRGAIHPLRLIVGFDGGAPKNREGWSGVLFRGLASTLPAHDRTLSFVWGRSALERGKLVVPPAHEGTNSSPYYIVRGGRENANQWWLETVDLSDLYARAWPGDAVEKAHVVFIGLAAEGNRMPASAYFSGIRLSH